jgi:hypothetical protein
MQWLVTGKRDWREDNPDVLDFQQAMGCQLDVDESRWEIYREGPDGNRESYSPPRYEYSYYFNMTILVNSPWFDEIKFRLTTAKSTSAAGMRTARRRKTPTRSKHARADPGRRARGRRQRERAKTASVCPTAAPPPCGRKRLLRIRGGGWPDG